MRSLIIPNSISFPVVGPDQIDDDNVIRSMRLSLCIVQNLIELELEEEETVNKRNEKRERETMQN